MDRAVFYIGTIWTKLTEFAQKKDDIFVSFNPYLQLTVIFLFVIQLKFCTHMILNRLQNCNLISKFE